MGVNWGGAGQGAASGAATGTAVSPGWGTAIGGVIGGIAGLFSPKSKDAAKPASTTAAPGYTDAFTKGLGSLFGEGGGGFLPFMGGGSSPTNVTQTQDVNQSTNLNVQNVIGSSPFGGFDPETGLDPFKTIADVFAIKNASGGGTMILPSGTPSTQKSFNILPIILIGGGVAAFLLLKGK